ncbi:MAG: HPr family phosphocarrier protein [Bacillota bacterium]
MEKAIVTVQSKSGLHARPASIIVSSANKFSSSITLKKKDKSANGKSLISILGMAAANGDELEIIAEGQDEAQAVDTLKKLFDTQLVNE